MDQGGKSARRIVRIVFPVMAFVLIVSIGLTYRVGQIVIASNQRLAMQREILQSLDLFQSSLTDAETGQRGYLLTQQKSYLESFNKDIAELQTQLKELGDLAAAGDLAAPQVEEITRLTHEKTAELQETLRLAEAGKLDEALAIVRSNRGKELMDKIRDSLAVLRATELAEFEEAKHRTNRATQERTATFIGAGLVNLVFLGWAYGLIASELRKNEAIQREARELASQRALALDSADLGAWDYRFDSGHVFWDRRCREMFGVGAGSEISYDEAIKRISPGDRAGVRKAVEQALAGAHHGIYRREYRVVWPDGSLRWVASFGRVYFEGHENNRKPARFIGVNMDVTERRLAEEELRRLKAELEERVEQRTADLIAANKELEAFGYSVSHDLRAPLRHVSSYIKLLQKNADSVLDEKSRQHVRVISEAAQRMANLIDDLLVLSRLGRATMTEAEVNLDQLVAEVRAELAPAMTDRNIQWEVGPLPKVHGDPTLLRSALLNLLSNAVKYTSLRNPARIEVGSKAENGEVTFYVRDNGTGFDMQFVDKLFGVFQRLHSSEEFEGTGIGLASVRRVIQRHGGKTWAEGKLDEGATFYFSMPKERIL